MGLGFHDIPCEFAYLNHTKNFAILSTNLTIILPSDKLTSMFYLYRCFDASGDLLYIGRSKNWSSRWLSHRSISHWSRQVTRIEIKRFDSLTESIEAETEAIKNERPRFNVLHNRKTKIPKPKIDRVGITVDQVIEHCGGKSEAARRLGFTLQTFRNWRKHGIPARAQIVIESLTEGKLKADGNGKKRPR